MCDKCSKYVGRILDESDPNKMLVEWASGADSTSVSRYPVGEFPHDERVIVWLPISPTMCQEYKRLWHLGYQWHLAEVLDGDVYVDYPYPGEYDTKLYPDPYPDPIELPNFEHRDIVFITSKEV